MAGATFFWRMSVSTGFYGTGPIYPCKWYLSTSFPRQIHTDMGLPARRCAGGEKRGRTAIADSLPPVQYRHGVSPGRKPMTGRTAAVRSAPGTASCARTDAERRRRPRHRRNRPRSPRPGCRRCAWLDCGDRARSWTARSELNGRHAAAAGRRRLGRMLWDRPARLQAAPIRQAKDSAPLAARAPGHPAIPAIGQTCCHAGLP